MNKPDKMALNISAGQRKDCTVLVERAGIPEFIKNTETLKRWQVEILNSFVYEFSNGFFRGNEQLYKGYETKRIWI